MKNHPVTTTVMRILQLIGEPNACERALQIDDVRILSVERAQLPLIPSLEGTTSSCMVTGVVPATTPPTLKLEIRECNVLK